MARKKSTIVAVMMGLALSLFAGCTGEDGAATGATAGVAAAVSALIQAPVNAWIKATFPVPK